MTTTQQQLAGWQLDATGPAAYERYLVPKLFGPGAQALCDLAGIGAGDRVLDLGCGTGIVARTAAARVGADGRVVAVDVNPAMLEHARGVAAAEGVSVEWHEADASAIPAADASFDAALAQQVLQFLDDPAGALAEMARVLVPGGRLGLSVLRGIEHSPGYVCLADALERHAGPDAATMMRSPFAWPGSDRLRAAVEGAGFRDVHLVHGVAPVRFASVEAFVTEEAASSPLAGALGELPGQARAALLEELVATLEPYADDDGVVFPAQTRLLTATRP